MPLNADALTTVATARVYLRDTAADQTLLELLINGYSKRVIEYTARQFFVENAVSKSYDYWGNGVIDLSPYELRTVTSVTLDGAEVYTALNLATGAGHYVLEPRQKTAQGTYLWLRTLRLAGIGAYPSGGPAQFAHDLTIVGDWGMAAVPTNAELATLVAVADAYRNPEGFGSRNLGPLAAQEVGDEGAEINRDLPDDAKGLLEGLRRPLRLG